MPGTVDLNDISLISTNLEEMAKFYALNANVHTYTRQIGNYYTECFYPLDVKYQFSSPGHFKETYNEILRYCGHDPAVKSALDTLAASHGKIEPETGLNGQDLLVRTWQLGKKQTSYANALDVVIDNLRQNKLTGGGCLAGIVGRLVLPYALFVDNALNDKLCYPQLNHPQTFSDEEMEIALALSLSEQEAKQKETNSAFVFALPTFNKAKTLTFTRFEKKPFSAKQRVTKDGFNADELEFAIKISKLIY